MATIVKLLTDGVYDSNDSFKCLSDNGILPCIKIRKNARVKLKPIISLETCQLYPKEMICKNGRIA
ncbi:MAG: hypothetical protein WKF36_11795 [Candidatus Nitrosocosmicus sp.]